MRVSSGQIFQQTVAAMQKQQSDLLKTEMHLTSGLRIMRPSDDPSGAVKVMNLESNIATVEQYARNSITAESALAVEEDALKAVTGAIQRIRELTVQANNSTNSDADKASIAKEIGLRFDELLALANTRDGNGEYIFGGNRVESPPFTANSGSVNYQGDDGQRFLSIGEGAQVAIRDSGRQVFQSIASGDGNIRVRVDADNAGTAVVGDFGLTGAFVPDRYTVTFSQATPDDPVLYEVTDSATPPNTVANGTYEAGESIEFAGAQFVLKGQPADGDVITLEPAGKIDLFGIVKDLAGAMAQPAADDAAKAAFHNAMGQGLAHLDQALDHISNRRGAIGARLNNIESMSAVNEDFKLQLETVLSETRDLDYAEAISTFNRQLTSLQAAQQVFVKTTGLSLFQYL